MGPIGSPETSVSNHLTQHNNPEDGRIQCNSGGSLQCSKETPVVAIRSTAVLSHTARERASRILGNTNPVRRAGDSGEPRDNFRSSIMDL